jgi:hypothetical protein
MTAALIHGDPVSCSRVGGAMRRESSRLRQHAQSLDDALGELASWDGPDADGAMTAIAAIAASLVALRATADDLDQAGAAVQRYATDLAESHELGRRAELRVVATGLLLDETRVIEPWGPASAHEAALRRAKVPEVQARVDLATAQVGRARGRLRREVTRLTEGLSGRSRTVRSALPAPRPHPRADPAVPVRLWP